MRFFILMVVVSATLVAAVPADDSAVQARWEQFIKTHGKVYASSDEEALRRSIWLTNSEFIEKHNAEGKHSFKVGMNQFGDLTNEEFRSKLRSASKRMPGKSQTFNVAIPDSIDWRSKGCVEAVRTESEGCNDIYAVGASESLGGIFCAKTGKMTPLSSQQIIDCSRNFGNQGCEGGFITQSFMYIKAAPGADSKASYPSIGGEGKCQFNPSNVVCTDSGFVAVPKGNETVLTAALANVGPISVYIDASRASFQFYQSGIYYDPGCNPDELDHILLLVGYGSMGSGADYYIGKNSWGTSWGLNGYVNMARNRNNNCGIASDANYPVLA